MTFNTLRGLGGAAAVAAVVVLPAVPAVADHSGDLLNRDNNNQEFDSHSLGTKAQLACSHGKSQLGSQTEINVSVGAGDVHCYDSYWAGDDGAITRCSDPNWLLNRCDDYEVRFNTRIDSATNAIWKSVGCHEMGHTSSVGHRWPVTDGGAYSCMRTGSGAAQAGHPTTYDSHDIDEINGDA